MTVLFDSWRANRHCLVSFSLMHCPLGVHTLMRWDTVRVSESLKELQDVVTRLDSGNIAADHDGQSEDRGLRPHTYNSSMHILSTTDKYLQI